MLNRRRYLKRRARLKGRKRRMKIVASTTGWNSAVREKESEMARKGFAFEIRLPHVYVWGIPDDEDPYADLIRQVRMTTSCRIVGLTPWPKNRPPARRRASVRIYAPSEAEVFQVRLLTDKVFRVYSLVAPS